MKRLAPASLVPDVPEFAAEHATTDAERRELAQLFARLGALPETDSAALAKGRARLLAAVSETEERFAPLLGKLSQFFDLSVETLRALFRRAGNEAEWEQGPLPWVSLFHFQGGPAVAGLDTGFVRLKKGMPFPPHRHVGDERVLILHGGYFDHDGHWYGPGDVHDMSDGTQHALQMSADHDVLLAVVMTDRIEVVTG